MQKEGTLVESQEVKEEFLMILPRLSTQEFGKIGRICILILFSFRRYEIITVLVMSIDQSSSIEHLISRAALGDRLAFDRLLNRHRDELRKFVSLHFDERLRGRADESDVVQDASLAAYRRMKDFAKRRPMPFRIWLRKTALERLKDLRRQHLAQCRDVSRQEPYPSSDSRVSLQNKVHQQQTNPSSVAENSEAWQALLRAINSLPETEREVLLLCYVEQLSQSEAAFILEVSSKTISKWHTQAVQHLATVLHQGGEES
jgi:RNA polymerase sigma-70 factor (ECF subfamily)